MKKLFLITSTFLGLFIQAKAQMNISEIFEGSTTYDLSSVVYSGSTMKWAKSFGTPQFISSEQGLYMWHLANWNGAAAGEGIFRSLPISSSTDVYISIGIKRFTGRNLGDHFYVLLVNDPVTDFACTSLGCPIMTYPGAKILFDYDGSAGNLTTQRLDIRFTTGVNESYKYIVLYPKQVNQHSENTELVISCFNAYSCGKGDQNYCETIPGGQHFNQNVNIGSSFCSLTSTTVNEPNESQLFAATNRIIVAGKTDLTPASSKPIELKIEACSYIAPPGLGETATLTDVETLCDGGAIGRPMSAMSTMIPQDVQIYPNPASKEFNISSNSNNANTTAYLYGPDGKIAREIVIAGGLQKVSLDGMPDGIYLLRIFDGKKTVTKKILKVK